MQGKALEGISNYLGNQKKIELIGLPMNVAQGQYAGKLLSSLPDEELKNTALVLGVEESLNIVLNALPKEVTPNITMGYALKNSKVSGFVQLMFEIHKNASSASFRASDCFKILLHPLSKSYFHSTTKKKVDTLVYSMRKRNLSYWN